MLLSPRIPSASAGSNTRFHVRLEVRRVSPLHVPLLLPIVRTTAGQRARW